jgi:hypothetical protein
MISYILGPFPELRCEDEVGDYLLNSPPDPKDEACLQQLLGQLRHHGLPAPQWKSTGFDTYIVYGCNHVLYLKVLRPGRANIFKLEPDAISTHSGNPPTQTKP